MPTDPHTMAAAPARRLGLAILLALTVAGCGNGGPSDLASTRPESIRLNMHAVRLTAGQDTTVVATLHDRYGYPVPTPPTGFQVTWSTSDPGVATVSGGVVRSVGAGTTVVTASAGSLAPATVDVHVLEAEGVIDGYQAMALGNLGGTRSNAWGINGIGVVVGWSDADGGRAFRWSEAEGMSALPGITSSRGINDAGDIVGLSHHASGWTAYVYANGVRTDLAALQDGSNTTANRINGAGTIVGISDPIASAVVWHRGADGSYGSPQDLGYRSRNERPVVNGHGDVAFTAFAPNSSPDLNQPVLWKVQPDGSYGDAVFLGRPAGGSHFVRDINDAGLIVGFRWTGAIEMAVLWHPVDYATPVDLGEGEAWGINAHGHIVGVYGGELPGLGGQPRRPVLWKVNDAGVVTGPFDLGTPPGYAHAGARAINDSGWIVGSAWGPDQVMATLWWPEP
jgi:probable HAF family extracellular repeat protein